MTDTAGDASQWAPCHCCGKSFPADTMVRFERHPEDALCVGCAQWLNDRARPLARRNSALWRLPARMRPSPFRGTTPERQS
jgi:hypothetical protein